MVEENKEAVMEEEIISETNESEEIVSDETTTEVVEENDELAEWKKKAEDFENRYLRLQADIENMRRRNAIDKEASMKYRSQSLITDILPVLDNFDRAIQSTESTEATEGLLSGMEMVRKQLFEALAKEGVEPIEAVGKQFDPTFHQAVMNANDPEQESNIVLQEFQKGYSLKDKVIRPSMVQVNQ